MSLFEVISAAGWTIYPMIVCSILAVAFIIERFMALRVEKIVPPKLVDEAAAHPHHMARGTYVSGQPGQSTVVAAAPRFLPLR